jgi:hypothetical protein
MTEARDTLLRRLCDRRAIRDCVSAYAHAVDRHDDGRIAAVFHPDAIDDHGRYVGGVEGFVRWVNGVHEANEEAHAHNVTTHCCDIAGHTAHAESYVLWVLRHRGGGRVLFGSGRYLDRLERRGGVWRIALRKVIREIRFECDSGPTAVLAAAFPTGRWDRSDRAYALEAALPVGGPHVPAATEADLARLADLDAIRGCVASAARAADRADLQLAGEIAEGEVIRDIVGIDDTPGARTHNVATHVTRLDGDGAEATSQMLVVAHAGAVVTVESRRVGDRLERRGSGWRIVARRSRTLWRREAAAIPLNPDDGPQLAWRDRRDLSYQRPLSL